MGQFELWFNLVVSSIVALISVLVQLIRGGRFPPIPLLNLHDFCYCLYGAVLYACGR